MDKQYCEICDRQANYLCGQCKTAAYCTNQHRLEHWRVHKDHCKILQTIQQISTEKDLQNKRRHLRKQYFQTFSNRIFDHALQIAQQLFKFQIQVMKDTRFIVNQFQYGVTVCLVCRTLIILQKKAAAKITIDEYLSDKKHFLEDMRDIQSYSDNEKVNEAAAQFLKKKLELISAVANIFYCLSLCPIVFYETYLNHVQLAFGTQSFEASNCFFLIGTYYMEKSQFNKSIACFVRAANIRGSKGGDCYFNLAIIYEMKKKYETAIKFFQHSIKLKQDQEGQNSIQIAKIYQSIGQLQIRTKNFTNAIKSFQKSLKIYANKNQLSQFEGMKNKIRVFHDYIKSSIQSSQKSLLPKQIQDKLAQKKIKEVNNINESNTEQVLFVPQKKERFVVENLIRFSQNFLNLLNPMEIFRLSQLQLELQKCTSQYAVAYTVANSQFLKRLGQNKIKDMRIQNQKLFELMNIQRRSA